MDGGRRRVGGDWVLIAALAIWVLVGWPLVSGERTLFLRDVFGIHQPFWAAGAKTLAAGDIPLLDLSRGLGQPYAGNPQAQAFYPSRLLTLLLPFWSAFNLHYLLHWLLALFTMRMLGRRLGLSPPAALLAALAWAGGGWVLTCLSFAHTLVVSAWWPLVTWGVLGRGRGSMAVASLAVGLALLGGEPIVACLLVAPLLALALVAHGWAMGLRRAGLALILGALVALPQLVATARIMPGVGRGHTSLFNRDFALAPQRLVELVLPLPFGWPAQAGPLGWAAGFQARVPLILSLSVGIVALVLALVALVPRRGDPDAGRALTTSLGLLAAAGYTLAWLGGVFPGALAGLTFDLVRYPEKFLVWPAFTLPLVAGLGLDRAVISGRLRGGPVAGWTLVVASLPAVWWSRRAILPSLSWLLSDGNSPALTCARSELLALLAALGLATGGLLVLSSTWAVRHRRPAVVAGLELLALLALFPLVPTTEVAPLRARPAAMADLPAGAGVFSSTRAYPPWHQEFTWVVAVGPRAAVERLEAATLGAVPGRLLGLTDPLARDAEGLSWGRSADLNIWLADADWATRVAWLRVVGVQRAVLFELPRRDCGQPAAVTVSVPTEAPGSEARQPCLPPGLQPAARLHLGGRDLDLVDVVAPAPEVWWPAELIQVPTPRAVVPALGGITDPTRTVIVELPLPHRAGGVVGWSELAADRVSWQVRSPGGITVVRRAWHHLWQATLEDGSDLPVGPVDEVLTGVFVPPGEHVVTLRVDHRPERLAGVVAGLTALVLAAVALRRPGSARAAPG